MKGSRRVLFSLMVALVALSAPVALPAHAEGAAPQPIVSFGGSGSSANNDAHCHTGSFCGG